MLSNKLLSDNMNIWYFETSAVNEFMKGRTIQDALATKNFQLDKERDWRLSPVTLWEILMTSNESRREEIIYFCQHLFGRELLPSPAELIIPYIQQGMPKVEKVRELVSTSAIANTWRDLIDDRNKTFILDHDDLRGKIRHIQSITQDIDSIIKNEELPIASTLAFTGMDCSLSSLVNALPFVKEDGITDRRELLTYKVSLYYIMLILCAEAELENEVIKDFWSEKKIDSTIDRVHYVVENLSTLVHRGPFIAMSLMTISQTSGKYSRGVWFDSMHSIYMTYVDKLFTCDGHFEG
ncbi:MAG: hypothetical protein COA71_13590 [SAR86 cluster bacterium]|uniref:Uncharacterized protein n=1 Tax=SAR86 cluster bacterium TaxID=2030880 RepID=A0A2A5C720_9GAMM|nr:MAG: hypothetical protein COA71_13590 [SAR86 cluster bacterium]